MLRFYRIGNGREEYFGHRPPGRWQGRAAAGLGCQGPVDLATLGLLLRGNDPRTGLRLPGLRRQRTRAGYELMIAAPKSVSLLTTLGGDGRAGIVSRAHQAAVADVITYLETNTRVVTVEGKLVVSDGWVVAVFDHRRNAAGEPHLHSHAVIVNLAATPGEWRCINTGPHLWAAQRAADARYFVSLDAHLRANGLNLEWDRTPSGSWEVADVPRAAVVAASSRRHRLRNPRDRPPPHSRPETGRPLARRSRRRRLRPPSGYRHPRSRFGPTPP